MKKIVSTLIALMMVLVCFAGCSSTPAADSDSSAPAADSTAASEDAASCCGGEPGRPDAHDHRFRYR